MYILHTDTFQIYGYYVYSNKQEDPCACFDYPIKNHHTVLCIVSLYIVYRRIKWRKNMEFHFSQSCYLWSCFSFLLLFSTASDIITMYGTYVRIQSLVINIYKMCAPEQVISWWKLLFVYELNFSKIIFSEKVEPVCQGFRLSGFWF